MNTKYCEKEQLKIQIVPRNFHQIYCMFSNKTIFEEKKFLNLVLFNDLKFKFLHTKVKMINLYYKNVLNKIRKRQTKNPC